MYFKKTVKTRLGFEFITKCKMPSYGRGGKRSPKSEPTSEKKKKYNLRKAIEKLFYILLENFNPGDYHMVLTYPAGTVQDISEAKSKVSSFLTSYRKYCKSNGYKCEYVYNSEIGERGAIHHHIILHRYNDYELIEDLWRKVSGGRVSYKSNLWANYDWYGLAKYFVDKTKDGKLPDTHIPCERHYVPSKGLKRPEITIERIDADRWYKPKAPKGYELISDSVRGGVDDLTGGAFLKYTIRRRI